MKRKGIYKRIRDVMLFTLFGIFAKVWLNSNLQGKEVNQLHQKEIDPYNYWSGDTTVSRLQEALYKELDLHQILKTKCTDMLLAADPSKSKLEFEDKAAISFGDTIAILVNLYDGYGRKKTVGGDHIRARLYNESLQAYTIGIVCDHKNGTYTVKFDALWTGFAKAEIELLYTRETFKDIRAGYGSSAVNESTPCHINQSVLRKSRIHVDICNFSYWNNTMPWFCLKPDNGNISCTDCIRYNRKWPPYFANLNKCEFHLAKRDKFRIGDLINITIHKASFNPRNAKDKKPCHTYNPRKLWFPEQSTGYFYKGKWILRHCKGYMGSLGECLRNTIVYFWGDSTTLQWFRYLLSSNVSLGCKIVLREGNYWHTRYEAYCQRYNLWLVSIPHNVPAGYRYLPNGASYFAETLTNQVSSFRNSSKRLLLVHMYAHLQTQSIPFYIANILAIRRFIDRLERINDTKVLIKLPHTHRANMKKPWCILQPDYIGLLYESIIRKAFNGLYETVIALDNKEATIATKNIPLHPNSMVISAMVEQFINYICIF